MVVIPKTTNKVEFQEIIKRLRSMGWNDLVELLLDPDSVAYTKNGRLNKSAICRDLGITNKDLDVALEAFRKEFA